MYLPIIAAVVGFDLRVIAAQSNMSVPVYTGKSCRVRFGLRLPRASHYIQVAPG